MKKIKKHLAYYLSLVAILAIGLILVIYYAPNIRMQSLMLLITAGFYILWGLFHHFVNHELTRKIVIEYVLFGLLGISIFFFFIMGGLI